MTTVFALTFAILAPVIATLAANVPRKQLLLSGLGLFVVANLGTAIAPTFGYALLTRALAGVGAAMYSPTAVGSATVIVPRERVGQALSIVISGLTISTALGSPIGTVIGGLSDWRYTTVFVALLAAISFLGVLVFLSHIPMLPAITMSKRLASIADRRVIDSIGTRKVLNTMMAVVLLDFALLHWTGPHLGTAVIATFLWGACGWGTVVPLQHRLVGIVPPIAPILLGLNNSPIGRKPDHIERPPPPPCYNGARP